MDPSFFIEYRREIALVGRLLLFFAVITLYFYIRPKLKDQTAKAIGYVFVGLWLAFAIWIMSS